MKEFENAIAIVLEVQKVWINYEELTNILFELKFISVENVEVKKKKIIKLINNYI